MKKMLIGKMNKFVLKRKRVDDIIDDKIVVMEVFENLAKPKQRLLFVSIPSIEDYVIVKATPETTAMETIQQVLMKAFKADETVDNYRLLEDVQKGWDHREIDKSGGGSQRVLDWDEKVLQAQSKWKGSGRLILRKSSSDAASRAWTTTNRDPQKKREGSLLSSDASPDWDAQTFLVCIYVDVSTDQPYVILQSPTSSTALDVVSQVMAKLQRLEDVRDFVICEEIYCSGGSVDSRDRLSNGDHLLERRILTDDENVLMAQLAWRENYGKFLLVEKSKDRTKRDALSLLHRLSFGRLPSIKRDRLKQKTKPASDAVTSSRRMNYQTHKIWEWQARNAVDSDAYDPSTPGIKDEDRQAIVGVSVTKAKLRFLKPK